MWKSYGGPEANGHRASHHNVGLSGITQPQRRIVWDYAMWCATHEFKRRVQQARVDESPVKGTHFEPMRHVDYNSGCRFERGSKRCGSPYR